jgi:D-beta-D-heptose 7-phosphate kinase/D-beta-D-heptose 1-phosphate adenosyltransferase
MDTLSVISNFEKQRIIVIGDIMLDRFIAGSVSRISPEAPVPVLKSKDELISIGGAGNVAVNLMSLGACVKIFGVTGNDDDSNKLSELLKQTEIDSDDIITDPERITTTKTRIISRNQQILRIDHEQINPISIITRKKIVRSYIDSINKFKPDGIIISDYAKGLMTRELCKEIIKHPKVKNIFVAVDPKGRDFTKYKGASMITPNQTEAEEVCGFNIVGEATIKKAMKKLIKITGIDNIIITRGKEGISYCVRGENINTVHSNAREIFDVTGAGDTVVSVLTLSYLSSKSWEESVRIANAAAGVVVGRVGTVSVTQRDLLNAFVNNRNLKLEKIVSRNFLLELLSQLRKEKKKITFTNGCFDLFHKGHLHLLNEAKNFGDILIVGVNDDDSVKRIKGEQRPYIPALDRARMIAELECVDFVVVFAEDTPLELIKMIKPDILVKGSDYKHKKVIGSEFVEGYGGKVKFIEQLTGISTSTLLSKIRHSN